MNLGILGAGHIAEKMAETVRGLDGAANYAVASRDLKKAQAFAGQYGVQKAYGSYEELLADPAIDLVYVATPHSHHYPHVRLCLEHGKHVLCEKSFTVNEAQAARLLVLAKEKNLLLTEAIWTRYMPSRKMVLDLLEGGAIGKPAMLSANLGYYNCELPRMHEPGLAGGALLDLGVYPINFALMFFGSDVAAIASTAAKTDRGLDAQDSITFTYADGRMAVLHATMMARTDRHGIISGSKGYLVVDNINNIQTIDVYGLDDNLTAHYDVPPQITGYEYEVLACMEAIKTGSLECGAMPHSETLHVMHIMDELRKEWGVRFPDEIEG